MDKKLFSKTILITPIVLSVIFFSSISKAQVIQAPVSDTSSLSTESQSTTVDQAEPLPELVNALQTLEQAEIAVKEAQAQNNIHQLKQAQHQYHMAMQNMIQHMAQVAAVKGQDIASMQQMGLSWGQIAEELGLNPNLLGLKSVNQQQLKSQVRQKTMLQSRNMVKTEEQQQMREQIRLQLRSQMHVKSVELHEATIRDLKSEIPSTHGVVAIGSPSHAMGLPSSISTSHGLQQGLQGMSTNSHSGQNTQGTSMSQGIVGCCGDTLGLGPGDGAGGPGDGAGGPGDGGSGGADGSGGSGAAGGSGGSGGADGSGSGGSSGGAAGGSGGSGGADGSGSGGDSGGSPGGDAGSSGGSSGGDGGSAGGGGAGGAGGGSGH